jgi:tryptophan 2,3-dioxygenase
MRHLEILLGLRPQNRIGHSTYREQFTPRQQQLLHQWEAAPSLHDLVTSWLRTIRVPTQFIQELRDRVSTPEDYPFDDPTDPRWAALYVLTYRMEYVRFPQFAAYARVMDAITGMEEAMLLWRSTHPRMVERMIGTRTGTGGSSGVGYLDRTREYRIFKELWWLRTAAIHPMPSLDDLLARSAVDGGSKQQRTIDALRDAGATI